MKSIQIKSLRIDGGTQSRVSLNDSAVADYADAILNGETLPPVVAFFDGSDFWLADGFHRFHAHRAAGAIEVQAEVREGTRRDAVLYSVGANASHGLRRTNEDKRRAVQTLLDDVEWSGWSDREIAKQCGVSHSFVAAIRAPEVAIKQQANRESSAARKSIKVESDSTASKTDNTPSANDGGSKAGMVAGPTAFYAPQADQGDDAPEIMKGYDPLQDVISDADLLESERKENAILQAQVDAMRQSDQAAELETQIRIRFGVEAQNTANMTKVSQLDKELRYLGKLLAELRKILKVENNSQILNAVKSLFKEAA